MYNSGHYFIDDNGLARILFRHVKTRYSLPAPAGTLETRPSLYKLIGRISYRQGSRLLIAYTLFNFRCRVCLYTCNCKLYMLTPICSVADLLTSIEIMTGSHHRHPIRHRCHKKFYYRHARPPAGRRGRDPPVSDKRGPTTH